MDAKQIDAASEQTSDRTSLNTEKEKKNKYKKSEPSATKTKPSGVSEKRRRNCDVTPSSSHTQYYAKDWKFPNEYVFKKINSKEYFGTTTSSSDFSNISCMDEFKADRARKKQNIKSLDPCPEDFKWIEKCRTFGSWELVKTIEFLLSSPVGVKQTERLKSYLADLVEISKNGYKIDILRSFCNILNYLVETLNKPTELHDFLLPLFENIAKPIHTNQVSDVVTYFEELRDYLGFLGYLLLLLENDKLFDTLATGLQWQLCAKNAVRGQDAVRRRQALEAAAPTLYETVSRMIAIATPYRFPTYLNLAVILVSEIPQSCLPLMECGILENIFYRFNPYFPHSDLPWNVINPADCRDINLKLGASSKHIAKVLCLILILLKAINNHLEENPSYRETIPCPDAYAIRCFAWAFRYECRAPEHKHERNTFVVIMSMLVHIYRTRINELSTLMCRDLMDLSVMTEIKPRSEWTLTVSSSANQANAQFKKSLIYLIVQILHYFPCNVFMIESQHWFVGLVYLIDPNLFELNKLRMAPCLYYEVQLSALQALVFTIPMAPPKLADDCNVIRRVLWYIEWYANNPYNLNTLYWCVRLLHVSIYKRNTESRKKAIHKLFHTHGIIILMHVCDKLLDEKQPPVSKSEVVIALCLRLITSALIDREPLHCQVYKRFKWPESLNSLVAKMLDDIIYYLARYYVISYKWITALLNLIWEGIVWNDQNRQVFITQNGVYKLLDLISITKSSVQCMALAVLCDIARAGDAVGQLVTWRASLTASLMFKDGIKRGDNITHLIAKIFKQECHERNISIDRKGVLQDLEYFLMSPETREELFKPDLNRNVNYYTSSLSFAAADLAGSHLSKVYALLSMLSEDLEYKVSLADETYKLYSSISLDIEQQNLLLLCSHYLTMKLNETWLEIKAQCPKFLSEDNIILEEFISTGRGWVKEIQNEQKRLLKEDTEKDSREECSLYTFLGRVRLTMSLDALGEVRCAALTAHATRISVYSDPMAEEAYN